MTSIPNLPLRSATRRVEPGVDFSFRSAFRESWGLVNLLQIAGRANRSGEFPDTEVCDFRHDESGGLSQHPRAKVARGVLADIFKDCAKHDRFRRFMTYIGNPDSQIVISTRLTWALNPMAARSSVQYIPKA